MDPNVFIINDFLLYVQEEIGIETLPKVHLVTDRSFAVTNRSFGAYKPSSRELFVYIANRNTADVLRTLAHELVHHRQCEIGMDMDGETGSYVENQANSIAGVLLRNYGKEHEVIYERKEQPKKGVQQARRSAHAKPDNR